MIHHIEPDIRNCHGKLSRDRKPILAVDSGDTIVADTRFCSWGLEPPPSPDVYPALPPLEDRADPVNDTGNCLLGPVEIRGAKPGMTLEVAIESMKCASYGITMIGGGPNPRYERLGLPEEFGWIYWAIDNAEGVAQSPQGYAIKLRPFLGSMGNCPNADGYLDNMAPRSVGGNIDCKELVAGSRLYLPIEVSGAMFSFGDGHAAQGDGEVGGAAIECPMTDVTLTLSLLDDFPVAYPVAKTPEGWVTFGFAADLHDAAYIAVNNMLGLMTWKLGISRQQAAMLASAAVDVRVTQMVNPAVCMHALLRHDAL